MLIGTLFAATHAVASPQAATPLLKPVTAIPIRATQAAATVLTRDAPILLAADPTLAAPGLAEEGAQKTKQHCGDYVSGGPSDCAAAKVEEPLEVLLEPQQNLALRSLEDNEFILNLMFFLIKLT